MQWYPPACRFALAWPGLAWSGVSGPTLRGGGPLRARVRPSMMRSCWCLLAAEELEPGDRCFVLVRLHVERGGPCMHSLFIACLVECFMFPPPPPPPSPPTLRTPSHLPGRPACRPTLTAFLDPCESERDR
ncbi:hypothetical protein HDK77DRAFT_64739 [Phyllosticta capitalensis]